MIQPEDTVVAGISGGADSVSLLLILLEIKKIIPFHLVVVHVNHKIREEAMDDADFVKNLCEKVSCEYCYVEEDVEGYAKLHSLSTEEAGRILRYQAFERVLQEKGGNGKIAIAHNQNDNAETVLFHMFRGTGLAGLTGIRPVRGNIIRPLLCVDRKEIETFLDNRGISFCTDRTNNEDTYARNRIRHHIMEYAEQEICKGASAHIAGMAAVVTEAEEYIREQVKQACEHIITEEEGRIRIRTDKLQKENQFLQKQILLFCLEKLTESRKDISSVHIEVLYDLCEKSGNRFINLPYKLCAAREYDTVVIYACREEENTQFRAEVQIPDKIELEGIGTALCRIFPWKKSVNIPLKSYTKWFDYDKIEKSLVLRTRESGDYLTINSEMNRKTLKDYLKDEKVPRSERDKLIVLADGNHVLWVIGHRISEYYKISRQTKNILEIQILGGTQNG